ncbi:UNVERIFIED_ORG: hypothetical protein J2S29_005191 [Rhizobium sp. SLBN-170]
MPRVRFLRTAQLIEQPSFWIDRDAAYQMLLVAELAIALPITATVRSLTPDNSYSEMKYPVSNTIGISVSRARSLAKYCRLLPPHLITYVGNVLRAGCNSPPAVSGYSRSPRALPVSKAGRSADPVRGRSRRYSPDGRGQGKRRPHAAGFALHCSPKGYLALLEARKCRKTA